MAYSISSRVWFTLSHGIVNEVYYPTIDRPQIRDLQFLITDSRTFCHEERRDLHSEIQYLQTDTLGYRITNSDPQGRYRIIKEIIADPHQPCLIIHTRIEGNDEFLRHLKIYVLLAPHLQVGGSGNSASCRNVAGKKILVAWKGSTFLALGTNAGFSRTSCGFAGASDGWNDLHNNYQMDWQFDRADDGNVAVTGQIDLGDKHDFTVALGFGDSLHAAVTTVNQSLTVPFSNHRDRFIDQWHRVCCNILDLDDVSGNSGRLYRISHSLLLAHEDKTFAGAFIASASIPWGQAKGDEDIGGYHLVWTRDMFHSATGLLACGDLVTPLRALVYLACSQRADGGFPQNFWIDGTPYWSGIQLDQVALPIMLAWRLWQLDALQDFDPYTMVLAAAGFLICQGPATQQERWEENSGYSPSTLAASIAALICAASFARHRGDPATAVFLEEYADFMESHIESWTVTTAGRILPEVPRHYIRIHPTDIRDSAPVEDPNCGLLVIPNRSAGQQVLFPAKDIVDPSFLELVRYGIRKPGDTLIEDSLRVVDAVLKVQTPAGPCWRRYNHDGYGQRSDAGPFLGSGTGRAWPLLTAERGHYQLAAGRDPKPFIRAMENFASTGGMLPEQIWDQPDMPEARMFLGRPTGSAMPLMWAHAEYIKLLRSTADQQVFDLIPIVAQRYLSGKSRKDLEVWKPVRQVRQIMAGKVLRIQAPRAFRLRCTSDQWQTHQDIESTQTYLGIGFVDLNPNKGRKSQIDFTFYWSDRQEWEGRNYTVYVDDQAEKSH